MIFEVKIAYLIDIGQQAGVRRSLKSCGVERGICD